MGKYNINNKPSLDKCPEQYCFCWTPPGGSADLSGKEYDTFEEAVEAGKQGVTFLHGGCATPVGPCRRNTKNAEDRDCYESFNRFLSADGLPEIFFYDIESLAQEFKEEYKKMALKLWRINT